MKEAATNSTVLIFLAKINKLKLLKVYQKVLTTKKIREEILEGKNIPKEEKKILEEYLEKTNIKSPSKILDFDLGEGESSALSLCIEKKINIFLSDDKKARKTAEIISLKTVGTLGIVLLNLKQKKITKQEAKNILQKLIENSYYLNTEVYAKTINLIENS